MALQRHIEIGRYRDIPVFVLIYRRRPRGVTPRPRSGAVAESASLQQRRNRREELPVSKVRGGNERSYLASEVRDGGREDQPGVQGSWLCGYRRA